MEAYRAAHAVAEVLSVNGCAPVQIDRHLTINHNPETDDRIRRARRIVSDTYTAPKLCL